MVEKVDSFTYLGLQVSKDQGAALDSTGVRKLQQAQQAKR